MISEFVYMLCAMTSFLCAVLLYLKHFKKPARLLLWSGHCFAFLALNNALLFADFVLTPQIDLSALRTLPAAIGFFVLLWGFIWDTP